MANKASRVRLIWLLAVAMLVFGCLGEEDTTGDSNPQGDIDEEQDSSSGLPWNTNDQDEAIVNGDQDEIDSDDPAENDSDDLGEYDLDPVEEEPAEEEPPEVDEHCAALVDGWNYNFPVDGAQRSFILTLPTGVDDGGPWPVIFNWHGMGMTADQMEPFIGYYVNNEVMPYIGVTPEDTNITPPFGMDWDNLLVNDPNKEIRLYDEILECIDQRWGVNRNHIHTMGFSAGAFMSDLLGTMRGEEIASIAAFSGGYINNPENTDDVPPLLSGYFGWPDHDVSHRYVQFIAHGDVTDTYGPILGYSLKFNEFAASDTQFLNERGHDIILCNHGGGHDIPASMQNFAVVRFFADHPFQVEDSRYATEGLPSEFPNFCDFYEGD